MLIFRKINREIIATTFALLLILLVIVGSRQIFILLAKIAQGQLLHSLLLPIFLLSLPTLLSLLLPLAFFLAVIIIFSRLYAHNEMIIIQCMGISFWQIFKKVSYSAMIVIGFCIVLNFYLIPIFFDYQTNLAVNLNLNNKLKEIKTGNFYFTPNHRYVFFMRNSQKTPANSWKIFIASNPRDWLNSGKGQNMEVTISEKADVTALPSASFIILHNGSHYQANIKQQKFNILHFKEYGIKFPYPHAIHKHKLKAYNIFELLHNIKNRNVLAELLWRFNFTLAPLILLIVALSLSVVSPRQGRFVKILPAVIIFVLYYYCIFMSKLLITSMPSVPAILNIIILHSSFLLLSLFCYRRF